MDAAHLNEKYPPYTFEFDDGVLQVRRVDITYDVTEVLEGESLDAERAFTETTSSSIKIRDLWREIGDDTDVRVVICTAAGDVWEDPPGHDEPFPPGLFNPTMWEHILYHRRQSLLSFLDIPAPIIAAVQGPATVHAEWALLADIVLAGEDAVFQDKAHYAADLVPGDGVQAVWPALIGVNRARHFLLTGKPIDAREALDLGLVAEVLPTDQLVKRAYEIAEQLKRTSTITSRLSIHVIRQELKERLLRNVGFGLALEGLDLIYKNNVPQS
jgi:enoyl-CoA hydratase/carnithine racemase